MWLKVTKSNNHPDIIANFYLNCVAELGACPVKLRTDCGTENGVRQRRNAHFNKTLMRTNMGHLLQIRGLRAGGRFTEKNRSGWWIDVFKNLV